MFNSRLFATRTAAVNVLKLSQRKNVQVTTAAAEATKSVAVQSVDSLVHSVRVKVCGHFTRHHYLLRPWFLRYIPKGGYEMTIQYIDSKPCTAEMVEQQNPTKTILVLHNTPGSYYDYFPLIATFGATYRVIVPNFPTFAHTIQTGCFWHSAEEKSEFIADFLRAINVRQVDCLIAHSMAAYTASYLWLYTGWKDYFQLGSICLLSPLGMYKIGFNKKVRLALSTQLCRSSQLRNLFSSKTIYPLLEQQPAENSILVNLEMAAWKAVTLRLANFEKYPLRLQALGDKKIPTLFMFSSNDRTVRPNVYYDQLYELGATVEAFDIYEQYENELIQSADDSSWLKVVDFRSAGHYIHNTHPDIVHSYIGELIDRSQVELQMAQLEQ